MTTFAEKQGVKFMKLRIENNSIRLRLSPSEVEQFGRTGKVEGTSVFGPENQLSYVLARDEAAKGIRASLENQVISVFIPQKLASEWVETSLVSLEEEIMVAENIYLKLLVEKDFQKKRKGVPLDDDVFPNPKRT